ncbi:MAG: YedE family putative selenium transporter [Planctomycetota bacterium]
MKWKWIPVVGGGAVIGAAAVLLWKLGNPPNMGFCTACFERDIAGALGLHGAGPVKYLRPEIFGVLLGAFLIAWIRGEFTPQAGSVPLVKFFLGAFMMIGALVFLGCPLRMWQRFGAGDLNGLLGFGGLVLGIAGGHTLKKFRYAPPWPKAQEGIEAFLLPILGLGFLALFLMQSGGVLTGLFQSSAKGPGAMHPGGPASPVSLLAGILISLGVGILVGIIGQVTRFCTIGPVREALFFRKGARMGALLALGVTFGAGTAVFGAFKLGFTNQPIAHTQHLWNALGMVLVGLTGVLMVGCPFRQIVRAGGGDSDAAFGTLGLIAGAAFAHNFALAATPKGVPAGGKIAVLVGIAFAILIGLVGWSGERKLAPPVPEPEV